MSELVQIESDINKILAENDFPIEVVTDVFHRLNCCRDPGYAKQQLRFLQNFKRQILDKEKNHE
ncbi:DUF6877 family protein [Enterococcus casseliflavus]|uniref:DUF6877 family protein n=1 Tax=Enterococcus casseliflavus TaxID=37734 RepID=UPI002DB71B44|nr:DUF6877 family protein [Enterococcus casseliflavus]MEB6147371.1 hypothetical protein [Enterococcus casseliflavus]